MSIRDNMKDYLEYTYNKDDMDLVSAYDELPLWSAPFGLKLLALVRLKPELRVLDLGCGTGFPVIELAQRLGRTASLWGIDTWMRAMERLQMKVHALDIENIRIVCGDAEEMPFRDSSFDLIVANNGINNVKHPHRAIEECSRVSAGGAQLVMAMNLRGTMQEFYQVFKGVLNELGDEKVVEDIEKHINQKRMPLEKVIKLLTEAHFKVQEVREDSFDMDFIDGTAMLNYHFIKCNFLEAWKGIVAKEKIAKVFKILEENLNKTAEESGGLKLSVPYACLNCRRK